MVTMIANDSDLSKYHPAYNKENQKMPTPAYRVMDLIPPIRKHTFAPEVEPSGLIDDEAEFNLYLASIGHHQTFRRQKRTKNQKRMTQRLPINKAKKNELPGALYSGPSEDT